MKRAPNSKTNLDKAILRFAGEVRRSNELRSLMANAIVAQMIGEGVVKGGSGQGGLMTNESKSGSIDFHPRKCYTLRRSLN